MATRLEDLAAGRTILGLEPDGPVTVVKVDWFGTNAVEATYKTAAGGVANTLLFRDDEARLKLADHAKSWSFDGDGALYRLVSEAQRIRLAHLFDPVLAVHTSAVEPLPHQITAVYEAMMPRQPLRFLLADDPGAGKTIMAGLLIKELMARGDIDRCLIICPGNLAEQWQDELYQRFHLPFEILTNEKLETARTGNWLLETKLVIGRLDKLARDESVQRKLEAPDAGWDLVVCDEAHKLSATFFSSEIKYTKRYRLGQLVSKLTRHLLLMTATPHNGKNEDFQLFLALLDPDRFEGRFRDGVHATDVSDLMRRTVKEKLLKFDGKPLFPERIAHTVAYKLSDDEAELYGAVTKYVREEFNRADALANAKRAGTVGFALTLLQRRLASSPEAIHRSLQRRRQRLEDQIADFGTPQQDRSPKSDYALMTRDLDPDDIDDLDDAPETEVEEIEAQVLDEATAARSMAELRIEIRTLKELEMLALNVRRSGRDTKWLELANVLNELFATPAPGSTRTKNPGEPASTSAQAPTGAAGQKLIVFTEHRDTLRYLRDRISTLLGREDAIVVIHGSVKREARLEVQASFQHDPGIQVLLATDAAGEGINLQRAHLMVNYDLPWNPNRLEQRFGRIHRIGQTEVCQLWNLVAEDTREGEVYQLLLKKIDTAQKALGGQVFDVLGKLVFDGQPLRDLLLEAIRYGEKPEVKARLQTTVDHGLDQARIQDLLEDNQLVHDAMDATKVQRVREHMERAEAKRLQPHYINAFFHDAFERLGGTIRQREPRRYQISHVPAGVRSRPHGAGRREPVLRRYERVTFDKALIDPHGQPRAAFLCPGHSLLDAVVDVTLDQHAGLLKQGAALVDDRDPGTKPRLLFCVEHALQDAQATESGDQHVISKQVFYVETDADGSTRHIEYAPYLDYRPLADDEPTVAEILERNECGWIDDAIEDKIRGYAIAEVVPKHLAEVRRTRIAQVDKTKAAVKARLVKEITYWDQRANHLKEEERAGKSGARLNSAEARRRADTLAERQQARFRELDLERHVSARPPVVLVGVLVVPIGLIHKMLGTDAGTATTEVDTNAVAARARRIVMDVEQKLGFEPTDRELEKLGYDIESRVPGTGKLRFIEVKGRRSDAATITVTRNEILYSLNKPDSFILAIVELRDDDTHQVHYLRQPFDREPDRGAASVNYEMKDLIARAKAPL